MNDPAYLLRCTTTSRGWAHVGGKRVESRDDVKGTTRRQKPIREAVAATVGDDKEKNSWRGSRCLQDFAWVARERRSEASRHRYWLRARDRTLCHPPLPSRGWPTATATHAASREKSCAVVVPESLCLPLFWLWRLIPTLLIRIFN